MALQENPTALLDILNKAKVHYVGTRLLTDVEAQSYIGLATELFVRASKEGPFTLNPGRGKSIQTWIGESDTDFIYPENPQGMSITKKIGRATSKIRLVPVKSSDKRIGWTVYETLEIEGINGPIKQQAINPMNAF